MNFLLAHPSAVLSPYVKQYWMIENCQNPEKPYLHRIIPNGLMELNFYLNGKVKSADHNKLQFDNSIISGQQIDFFDLEVTGKLSIFSVTFKPEGAYRFFNLPLNEISGLCIPYKFFQKDNNSSTNIIEDKLNNSNTFSEKIEIIEKFLISQFIDNSIDFNCKRITQSVKTINQLFGNITIEELASEAYLSRKQYERIFNSCIGIAPKTFLRIVRFQFAIYKKQLNKKTDLTTLAHDCGYYDQSHMVNEFKKLSGKNPGDFFSECPAYSDYFSSL